MTVLNCEKKCIKWKSTFGDGIDARTDPGASYCRYCGADLIDENQEMINQLKSDITNGMDKDYTVDQALNFLVNKYDITLKEE